MSRVGIILILLLIISCIDAGIKLRNRPLPKKARIAIIGGGIGGTTVAYEIALKHTDVDIHLFEQEKIGGRLATVELEGLEFESGGSIIHYKNRYMSEYARKFNLMEREYVPDDDIENEEDLFTLFNGTDNVFTQSKHHILTILKMASRYGIRTTFSNLSEGYSVLARFARIYDLQKQGVPFHDIYQLLIATDIDFYKMMNITLKEHLNPSFYSHQYIKEFVFLATNVNYNQDFEKVHAFVGKVALTGAGSLLWSVYGGNKKIPEALLKHSGAKLIRDRVSTITLTGTSQYALELTNATHLYDFVVIACPQIKTSKQNIKLVGIPNSHVLPIKYQRTVATFVHGELNDTYFNFDNNNKANQIISVRKNLFFSSVMMVYPIVPNKHYDHRVYKVFSKERLTKEQLNLLFSEIHNFVVKDWYAYPIYSTNMPQIPFVIHDNLFYLNSIELAASAMEMSVISGKNIAFHVFNNLKKYYDNGMY